MLDVLQEVERYIPQTLAMRRAVDWKTVVIDYHPPRVDRLWLQWKEYRVYLHKIYPCQPEEALFHPHPWPSAMRVVAGAYEMAVGYGTGNEPPPVAAKLLLVAGSAYEMTEKDAWHYVRPVHGPALSVMVTGKPWEREAPGSGQKFRQLTDSEMVSILDEFMYAYTGRHYSDR